MKKIITIFVGSALVLALANCGAPTAKSVVEKYLKLAKIGKNDRAAKIIDAEFAKRAADAEQKIGAACNADDLKKIDASLDCQVSAKDRLAKATAENNDEAKNDAEAALKKCEDVGQLQPDSDCFKVLKKLLTALAGSAQ